MSEDVDGDGNGNIELECVYVLHGGDTISRNFVVVDHDIFWSSDHPASILPYANLFSSVTTLIRENHIIIHFLTSISVFDFFRKRLNFFCVKFLSF